MAVFPATRSINFIISGAIGGFVGFLLMEVSAALLPKGETAASQIRAMSIYFAGFGLAVGAALGATDGFLRKDRRRLIYGLSIGLVLGVVAGAVGGAAGQVLFSLVQKDPVSRTDVIIALDSSGSMIAKRPDMDVMIALDCSGSMSSNDPRRQRAVAATSLITSLAASDRVGIVHFTGTARLACPLNLLGDATKKAQVVAAANRVRAGGGTNLDAGLNVSIAELLAKRSAKRSQHIIFLTDGVGTYTAATGQRAAQAGIAVHTIGLGRGVNASVLGSIASGTGGKYYPVAQASELKRVFQEILDKHMANLQGAEPGSDPEGKRRTAAAELVDSLAKTDRVAVIDFDDQAKVLWKLQYLADDKVRAAAKEAIGKVDDAGGTNLTAGLGLALDELGEPPRAAVATAQEAKRNRHVIFLTDGMGAYDPAIAARAASSEVKIHTIGLGPEVDAALLGDIAAKSGGSYYPVDKASDLIAVFQKIFHEHMGMVDAQKSGAAPGTGGTPIHPLLLLLARVASWGVVGLAIGAGQGVRENSREDLLACSLGGLAGGVAGGLVFDPIARVLPSVLSMVARAVGDTVVGAFIGGSMRVFQTKLVLKSNKPVTTLISLLPTNERASEVRMGPRRRK